MHIPLASVDSVITSRNGGSLFYPLIGWDTEFRTPNPDSTPGYTNQSLICFVDYWNEYSLNTEGDTIHIATFNMHVASDSNYLNENFFPFKEGLHQSYGGIMWGIQDGLTRIYPEQTFPWLYFVDFYAGDANGSNNVNGLDVIFLVNYLKGIGPAPDPLLAGDANGNCTVNGMDVIYLVNYFKGGPEPFYGDCY